LEPCPCAGSAPDNSAANNATAFNGILVSDLCFVFMVSPDGKFPGQRTVTHALDLLFLWTDTFDINLILWCQYRSATKTSSGRVTANPEIAHFQCKRENDSDWS
jgi:hypothetical protein